MVGPEIQAMIERSGLGNNVAAIRAMSEIGKRMIEARTQIDAVRKDKNHPYHNTSDVNHRAAIVDMQQWETILAPFRKNLNRG